MLLPGAVVVAEAVVVVLLPGAVVLAELRVLWQSHKLTFCCNCECFSLGMVYDL